MAKKYEIPPKLKSAAKRLTPLLVVFVLIVGMLPVSALAATDEGYTTKVYIDGELVFDKNGAQFSPRIYFCASQTAGSIVLTYSFNSDHSNSAVISISELYPSWTFLGFSHTEGATSPEYYLLADEWTSVGGTFSDCTVYLYTVWENPNAEYTSTIYLDGELFYSASAKGQSPSLSFGVSTSSQFAVANNDTSDFKGVDLSGNGTLLGMASTSGATVAEYAPGETVTIGGTTSNVTYYAYTVYGTPSVMPTYGVDIYVDGVSIYKSAATADQCPVLLITVFDNGFYVYDEAGTSLLATYTYSGTGTFCGIRHTEDATLEIGTGLKAPGTSVTVGGQSRNVSVELNSVVSSSSGGVTTPTGVYQKVTVARSDWSGTYLIVYENSTASGSVFTGVDTSGNYISADIQNNTIYGTAALDVCRVKIEKYGDGYSIQLLGGDNAGMFINASKSAINKTVFNTTAQMLTISYDDSTVKILDGEKPFQFNKASNAQWFRFYGSQPGGQQEIALYRLDDGEEVPSFSTSVYIDGKLVFSDTQSGSSPDLTLTVNADNIVISGPSGSHTESYAAILHNFKGLALNENAASADFPVGFSAVFSGSAEQDTRLNFYTVSSSSSSSPVNYVSTTVNLYDLTSGASLGSYVFSGTTAPAVTICVTDDGCILYSGDLRYVYSFSGTLVGVSDLSSLYLTPDKEHTFSGGSSSDVTLNLYLDRELEHSGSGGSFGEDGSTGYSAFAEFGNFIKDVLGGFLGFSILPGLTFGGLLAVFVVLGIVKLFFSK